MRNNKGFNSKQNSKKSDNSWIWYIVIIIAVVLISKSGGCTLLDVFMGGGLPEDIGIDELGGSVEYDPGLRYQNQLDEYSRNQAEEALIQEYDYFHEQTQEGFDSLQAQNSALVLEGSNSGCPNGCIGHKSGCDIKGNVSFETGEKIYHVPGGEFYAATKINPDYGERWFCTEEEAIANGWRKSKE